MNTYYKIEHLTAFLGVKFNNNLFFGAPLRKIIFPESLVFLPKIVIFSINILTSAQAGIGMKPAEPPSAGLYSTLLDDTEP